MPTGWLTLGGGIGKTVQYERLTLQTDGALLGKAGGLGTGWLTLTSGIKSIDLG